MFLLHFTERNKLLLNNNSSVFIKTRCVLGTVLNILLKLLHFIQQCSEIGVNVSLSTEKNETQGTGLYSKQMAKLGLKSGLSDTTEWQLILTLYYFSNAPARKRCIAAAFPNF